MRPLRLSFLVEPNDAVAVRMAIEASTFQWGGMLNSIVPYYRKLPPFWVKQGADLHSTGRSVTRGYLEAFDPDFVVKVGKLETREIECAPYEVIKCSDLIEEAEETGYATHGISLFEVLRHLYETELKFVRQQSMRVLLPEFGKRHSMFLSSVFGKLPPKIDAAFRRGFAKLPGLIRPPGTLHNYWDFLTPENLSLRRIGMVEIRSLTPRGDHHDCLFFMDAEKPIDVIDYWNLRALGWTVVPVCRQVADAEGLLKHAAEFVEENSYPYRDNPSLYNDTMLLKSRTTSLGEFARFGRALKQKLKPARAPGETKVVNQTWFPRIWNEWARGKDGAEICEVEVAEQDYRVGSANDAPSFKSMVPEFADRFGGHGGPRCANNIETRLWGKGILYAEVIPVGGMQVVQAAGGLGVTNWRCSGSGLVYLPQYKNFTTDLDINPADRVFAAWLQEKKWEPTVSDKGHIANQMFKHLDGPYGLGFLTIPGMIDLVDDLAKKSVMRAHALRSALARVVQQAKNPSWFNVDGLLRSLVSHKLVQLGIEVQCPECHQHSWYAMPDAGYQLICTKCLEEFALPAARTEDIAWAYRAIGPFSLPQRAYGAISVLLTLRFFMCQLDGATTPMLSFTAKKGVQTIEVDLGLFFRWPKFQTGRNDLVLAECKTFNSFEAEDAKRMLALAAEFPGAILVFATLKRTLTKKEQRLLRPVVNRGRKYWKDERPSNPVIILTGNELLTDRHPRSAWQELGSPFDAYTHWHASMDLTALADSTQQLYLGMPPWHAWLQSRQRKRSSIAPPAADGTPEKPTEDLSTPFQVRMQQVPFRPGRHP